MKSPFVNLEEHQHKRAKGLMNHRVGISEERGWTQNRGASVLISVEIIRLYAGRHLLISDLFVEEELCDRMELNDDMGRRFS